MRRAWAAARYRVHGQNGAIRTWERQPRHRPSGPLTCSASKAAHTCGHAASSTANGQSGNSSYWCTRRAWRRGKLIYTP
jgi:hypothetical protein